MSTELEEFGGISTSASRLAPTYMTQYCGGDDLKECIQLTQARKGGHGYIQLTRDDAAAAIVALQEWLDGTRTVVG